MLGEAGRLAKFQGSTMNTGSSGGKKKTKNSTRDRNRWDQFEGGGGVGVLAKPQGHRSRGE